MQLKPKAPFHPRLVKLRTGASKVVAERSQFIAERVIACQDAAHNWFLI